MPSEIALTLIIALAGAAEPQVAHIPTDSIEQCMTYARQFLDSDTAKQALAASAGCTVKYKMSDAKRGS